MDLLYYIIHVFVIVLSR